MEELASLEQSVDLRIGWSGPRPLSSLGLQWAEGAMGGGCQAWTPRHAWTSCRRGTQIVRDVRDGRSLSLAEPINQQPCLICHPSKKDTLFRNCKAEIRFGRNPTILVY